MDHYIASIFAEIPAFYLSALLAAALFFLMAGVREFQLESTHGVLYVALAVFFFCAHFYYLLNLPDSTPLGSSENLVMVWTWLVTLFAPALIALFIIIGTYNFVVTQIKLGLTKIFFGTSLASFLYLLGSSWSLDIRGILTVVWCLIWLDVELETAS